MLAYVRFCYCWLFVLVFLRNNRNFDAEMSLMIWLSILWPLMALVPLFWIHKFPSEKRERKRDFTEKIENQKLPWLHKVRDFKFTAMKEANDLWNLTWSQLGSVFFVIFTVAVICAIARKSWTWPNKSLEQKIVNKIRNKSLSFLRNVFCFVALGAVCFRVGQPAFGI